jgi:putative DNA primase/helicase
MDSANIEHTLGFYRRLVIIPFSNTIPDEAQDRDLHKKILANPAGVINWIIKGAEEVIRNRDIFISEECHQFKAQFLKETDSVAMFEEDFRENMKNSIYFKTVGDSYREYKAFCREAGYRVLGRTSFSKQMVSLGFKKKKVTCGYVLEKNYCAEML